MFDTSFQNGKTEDRTCLNFEGDNVIKNQVDTIEKKTM